MSTKKPENSTITSGKTAKDELNQIFNSVITIYRKIEKTNCSIETLIEYRDIYKRYKDGYESRSLLDLTSKSTYRKHKRAILVWFRRIAGKIVGEAQKSGKISPTNIEKLKRLLDLLEANGLLNPKSPCPIENPKPKNSKKKSLVGLPQDWLDIFWHGIPAKSKYRAQVAVMILFGARPEEIHKKVTLAANREKTKLTIEMEGAKRGVDDSNGQESRWLIIPMEKENKNSPAMYLFKKALNYESVIYCENTKRLYDFVAYWGEKFFGKRKNKVAPYTFRHQFAADIKADKSFDVEKIAEMLGQRSDKTQKNYGSDRQSRGKRNIESCGASNPVRLHKQTRNFPSTARSLKKNGSLG